MKLENKLLKIVTGALAKQTGILVDYSTSNLGNKKVDFSLSVSVPGNSQLKPLSYSGQVKTKITNTIISAAAMEMKNGLLPVVLISEYVAPPQAEILLQLNIAFFDTAGNAYLNGPGLYVFVTGKKTAISKEKPLGLFSPAGIKLLLAFLNNPGLENFDYRTIAAYTGVPQTTIGRLITESETADFLMRRGNRRFLVRKAELIKRWTEEYNEKFRVKRNPIGYHSTKFTGRWWEDINITEYKAVWDSETGGARLTKHLKPQTATICADSALPRLQAKYGLVRNPKGEIEILKKVLDEWGNKRCRAASSRLCRFTQNRRGAKS